MINIRSLSAALPGCGAIFLCKQTIKVTPNCAPKSLNPHRAYGLRVAWQRTDEIPIESHRTAGIIYKLMQHGSYLAGTEFCGHTIMAERDKILSEVHVTGKYIQEKPLHYSFFCVFYLHELNNKI